MPELPEVETITAGVRPHLEKKIIDHIVVRFPKLRYPIPTNLNEVSQGVSVRSVTRRGKAMVITLENDHAIIIRFGMSGRITILENNKTNPTELKKHDHLDMVLNTGTILRYNDARRFGSIELREVAQLKDYFKNMGPEPFDHEKVNAQSYMDFVKPHGKKEKTKEIKQILMEGKFAVGVGNIYACESLFISKIHPKTPANSLDITQAKTLITNFQNILKDAIKAGGSTLKDYKKSDGSLGYFQHSFKVYGKENQPCTICQTPIKRITQAQRSTWYCPTCQKDPNS